MVAKKKPAEKQTFLRPEDRLELLEAINTLGDDYTSISKYMMDNRSH